MGSVQSYDAVYSYVKTIKDAAHKNSEVVGRRKRPLNPPDRVCLP